MKKDVPVINLLKQPGECEGLIRYLLGTKGEVRIVHEMDPVFRALLVGKNRKILNLTKTRDLLSSAMLVESDECYAFVVGIEAQSECDPAMPIRMLLYDALLMLSQYEYCKAEKLGPSNLPPRQEEFERAFPDGMLLKPLYSIVIDLSEKKWFGPESIYELLDKAAADKVDIPPAFRQKIRRFRIRDITREQAAAIGGQFGTVARMVLDTEEGVLKPENYRSLPLGKYATRLYNVLCGRSLPEESKMTADKKINKYGLQREAEGEAKGIAVGEARGLAVGEARGRYTAVKNLMHNGNMNAAKAMDLIGIPASEHNACLKYIGLN